MNVPVVGDFLAERDRDGHLRHDRRTAASDQASIGNEDPRAPALRFDGGIHAGSAGADDQNIGFDLYGFQRHEIGSGIAAK
jgi:hypothetical protein